MSICMRSGSYYRLAAFQIPMRGNELAAPVIADGALWFQIPMRGNEEAVVAPESVDLPQFQIPMRGNEVR